MNCDHHQQRLFELPEPDHTSDRFHVRVQAELPGPGYDHVVIELINDTLSRLCHDQGLFPNQVTIDVDLDYIDDRFFDDSSTTTNASMITETASTPTDRPQPQ